MRATFVAAAVCAGFVFIACTPPEPPSAPPAAPPAAVVIAPPAATSAAEPAPEPAPEPPVAVAATSAPAPSSPPPPIPDLVDSPGDTRLDPAAGFIKAGQHLKARLALSKVLPDIDKSGRLDVKMAAHALLGRACSSLADAKCAADQYSVVRAAWKDPTAAVKELDAVGGDDKARVERLQRALNAAGEALFHAAEEKRLAADKERFPAYTGQGDKASVTKHINTKVVAWVKARRALMEEADRAYSAVTQIQPVPPPRWVVASAARVGVMWSKFVAEFRASPIPREWMGSGLVPGTEITREELRATYYAAIDEAVAPQRATVRAAFKKCQDMSQRFGIKDEYAKTCDAWMANNPAPGDAP